MQQNRTKIQNPKCNKICSFCAAFEWHLVNEQVTKSCCLNVFLTKKKRRVFLISHLEQAKVGEKEREKERASTPMKIRFTAAPVSAISRILFFKQTKKKRRNGIKGNFPIFFIRILIKELAKFSFYF